MTLKRVMSDIEDLAEGMRGFNPDYMPKRPLGKDLRADKASEADTTPFENTLTQDDSGTSFGVVDDEANTTTFDYRGTEADEVATTTFDYGSLDVGDGRDEAPTITFGEVGSNTPKQIPSKDEKPKGGVLSGIVLFLKYIIALILTLITVILIRTYAVQNYNIPSGSMLNTLPVGSMVVVEKLTTPKRGDIIVFCDDLSWMKTQPKVSKPRNVLNNLRITPDNSKNYIVKRIIGVGGDKVTAKNGVVYVNGTKLDSSQYALEDSGGGYSAVDFDVTVPKGHYYVLGDNRSDSEDSRYQEHKFISDRSVSGTVMLEVYHFKPSVIKTPQTFSTVK